MRRIHGGAGHAEAACDDEQMTVCALVAVVLPVRKGGGGILRFDEARGTGGREAIHADAADDQFSGAVHAVEQIMSGFCILEGDAG